MGAARCCAGLNSSIPMAVWIFSLCSPNCLKWSKIENLYWKCVLRHICSLICGSNSDIDPIFSCNTELNLIYLHAKKGLCFLLCLCNLNYLVVSCNLVPLQLLNKLHFVLNYCGEMAGHGAVHKRRRQLGGVKNWSKLPMDSTKKLPIMGVSKIQKNCRRLLWMAGHDRIKKPAAAAMKYVAISYCSIYDEKKRRERNNIFIQK